MNVSGNDKGKDGPGKMPKVKRMEASVTCEAWLSPNHAALWEINGRTGELVKCTNTADYDVHDVRACESHVTGLIRHMGDAFMNGTCAVRVLNPSNPLDDGENPIQLTDGTDIWEHVGSGFYVYVFRTGKRGMPTKREYLETFFQGIRPVVGPPLHWLDTKLVPAFDAEAKAETCSVSGHSQQFDGSHCSVCGEPLVRQ